MRNFELKFCEEASYAPVAIVTLDRFDCLERTIKALGGCKGADMTDVYISVDFPPSEKYEAGYKKVCHYLDSIRGNHPFGSLNLYFHKVNLGPFENFVWISRLVLSEHDSLIPMEDDNEVAPSFLDFCNKALRFFEGRNDVVAINPSDYVWCGDGYTPPLRVIEKGLPNVEKRQMRWHACAVWADTFLPLYAFVSNGGLLAIGDSPLTLKKLFKRSRTLCYQYLKDAYVWHKRAPWANGRMYSTDMVWDVSMVVFDKTVVCPIENLQRDLGVVGNGNSFKTAFLNYDALQTRELKVEPEFDFIRPLDAELNNREIELHDKFQAKPWWKWAVLIAAYAVRFLQRRLTRSNLALKDPWSENV